MKNKSLVILFAVMAGSFFSCQKSLNTKVINLAYDAVFEVVLEKPVDDPIVYEKEIDWDLVPFAMRNDKYHSIGTAFAISKTELITAFHVLEGGYDKYFVRDSKGNVYEVDIITGGSKEKDYIIFTVEGKTFDKFFQFEKKFKIGDPVFSIGNALGEGIVIRDGLVLGTVPEEDSGRWNLLKSSANSSPGNSGGPLVNPNGKVISLVTSRADNILYSTPADAILSDDRSVLLYRSKMMYFHILLANKLNNIFETQVSLPDTYTNINRLFREAYIKHYDDSLSALFEEAPEYLGEVNSEHLLNGGNSLFGRSGGLQISYVDSDDDKWKLKKPLYSPDNLEDDGKMYHTDLNFAFFSDFYFYLSDIDLYKINKPVSVSLEQICTDPKYIMEFILKSKRTDREIRDNKYRILSYGEPISTGLFRDSLGRTWITANWNIGFDYTVLIMYILPMPDGPVVITANPDSGSLHSYNWDLQKLCEHIFPVYGASFDEWDNFFALDKFVPDFLKNMSFKWNSKEQSFSLSIGYVSINTGKQVFDWNNKSELYLYPSWYKQDKKLEFGILKVSLLVDPREKEKIILQQNNKPDPKLGTDFIENWNDLKLEKFPYNETPVISKEKNNGFMGSIIKAKQPNPDVYFSLYLEMEDPQSERDISRRFTAFRNGVFIEM
jgi:hypothetical protein